MAKSRKSVLTQLVDQVQHNSLITVHLESQVVATSGFMGNFVSTVQDAGGEKQDVEHGVTILATGAQEYRGSNTASALIRISSRNNSSNQVIAVVVTAVCGMLPNVQFELPSS